MSHQEKAWQENKKKLISYQKYAFDLLYIEYENKKDIAYYLDNLRIYLIRNWCFTLFYALTDL